MWHVQRRATQNQGCFHIDATYKIVKYSYPLIILGFTDVQRQFQPLVFMFTSHEQTQDYDYFFESVLDICDRLHIEFKPKFIISDAASAIANSIKRNLPNTVYLMCWFHLKQNVKKHKSLIPSEELYLRVTKQINALHLASCPASYKLLLNSTLRSWRNDKNLVHFCNYFERQWVGYTNSKGEWRES